MKWIQKTIGLALFGALFLGVSTSRSTLVSLERQAPDTIEAEIKGEVAAPGLYTVKNGSSVQTLIRQAGGETASADLSALALGEELKPGQIIVVGKKTADGTSAKVSLNTASQEELTTLPGIGPAMAQRIIEYRRQTPFQSIEDLKNVKGIGDKTFEKLKEYLAL